MLLTTVLFAALSGIASGLPRGGIENKPSSLSTEERLDHLEHLVFRQNKLIHELQSQLSNQARLFQDALGLKNLKTAKLTRQWNLEGPGKSNARESIGQTNDGFQVHSVLENTVSGQDSVPQKETPTALKHSMKSHVSHIKVRSEDNEPLEAVVSQISQKITEMDAEILSLKSSYEQVQDEKASTFVHWGSSQCSSHSQPVYSGVVGGSHDAHPGGGVNYLCLTLEPVPSNHSVPSSAGYLYGGEYKMDETHMYKDPVCAVCRSSFSTTIMIPGTNVCAPGWNLDYSGFLMSGYFNHPAASEYICVDPKFESRAGGDAYMGGKLLYFTVTTCGSLPCEPYENHKVVTCAVCSK